MIIVDIVRFLTPIVSGFAISWACPIKDAGVSIPARPPAYVFGIVWTLLYILIGLVWIYASRISWVYDLGFIVLVGLLIVWVYLFGCRSNELVSLYVLYLSLFITFLLTIGLVLNHSWYSLGLVPLIVWLMFAGMLNYTIVNSQ